ncbi:MAG TPA: tlde1 domain-containing protein [Rhizomicrobium sp.]|jgi:hypothetical protein
MWTFSQETGQLIHDGQLVGVGYSGTGRGRCNPAMQNVANVGPIPQGSYRIGPASYSHPKLGPCVMALTPLPGTNTFGRSAFFIHGNNQANDASHGCVILGPSFRQMIANSDDRSLTVTA